MKLNIEELVQKAGGGYVDETEPQCWIGQHAFDENALEAFARLIVERCALECKGIAAGHTGAARRLEGKHATHAAGQRDGANECASAIRNLMED